MAATCPSCLSPVSPHATLCPFCQHAISAPPPVPLAPRPHVPPGHAPQARAEAGLLRRHRDGRAIYAPFWPLHPTFVVPEHLVKRAAGAQRGLLVANIGVLALISIARPPLPIAATAFGAWLAVLALLLGTWVPRGCLRVRIQRSDLQALDRSPLARAQVQGRLRLRISLGTFLLFTALGLPVLVIKPWLGLVMILLFGALAWDTYRCLRALPARGKAA